MEQRYRKAIDIQVYGGVTRVSLRQVKDTRLIKDITPTRDQLRSLDHFFGCGRLAGSKAGALGWILDRIFFFTDGMYVRYILPETGQEED